MKKITLFISLFSLIMGIQQTYAQTYNLLESFNGTGLEVTNGSTFGGANAVYATDPSGTNQVVKITSSSSGINNWQGLDVILPTNYRLTAATQLSMQLDVYSTTAITIAPKAQGGVAGATSSVTTASHNGSGWQTLTFTFNQSLDNQGPANGDYSDFALHINWNIANNYYGAPDGRIFYIKNLKGLNVAPPVVPAPSVAATTPPARNTADVISLYSDAYTNSTIDNWDAAPIWWAPTGRATFNSIVQSDNIKSAEFPGFIGADFSTLANHLDLTSMERFHMDIWTATATLDKSFNLKLVNFKADNSGELNAIEYSCTNASTPVALPNSNPGTWISIDMPLSAWKIAGGGSRVINNVAQFIVTSDLGKVYFDNVYMYKGTALGTDIFAVSKVKLYPNPASNVLNIESVGTIQNIAIYNVLGQEVMNKLTNKTLVSLDISGLNAGVYIIKTAIDGNVSSSKFIKE